MQPDPERREHQQPAVPGEEDQDIEGAHPAVVAGIAPFRIGMHRSL